jgi:polyisoprenoid-binding protein YceI
MKFSALFLSLILFPLQLMAEGQPTWDLPQKLNDKNTQVKFEVDTTWHVVYGEIKNTSGKVSLSNPEDLRSITAEIRFPVKSFSTGWDKRDDSLHDSMKADKYSDVIFRSTHLGGACLPETIEKEGSCNAMLTGTLQITDTVKEIIIPVTISKEKNQYKITGKYKFEWKAYNMEDPSIIIAKVNPNVEVTYTAFIPVIITKLQ